MQKADPTIALVGGTGNLGKGLALRFARDTSFNIIIGSREPKKAQTAVSKYQRILSELDVKSNIKGVSNETATDQSDIIILSVPPSYIDATVETISDQLDKESIIITPAVGMRSDKNGVHYSPPETGSMTELVANRSPDEISVVGAYHNLPAGRLANLELELDFDTLVVGDDPNAIRTVKKITNEIRGLRALEAGPIANAKEVESMTPLIINISKYNRGMEDVCVKWL